MLVDRYARSRYRAYRQVYVDSFRADFQPWARPQHSTGGYYTLAEIIWAVSNEALFPIDALRCKERWTELVKARHVACYLMRKKCNSSLPEIGRMLNRDHTSVMNGIARVTDRPKLYEPLLSNVLKRLEAA